MIGHRIGEFLSAESARSVMEACERVLNTRRPESIEYALDAPEGRRWFVARISGIAFVQGSRKTLSLLVRDITAHKEADLALRYSGETFRLLIESVKDYAIYMLDTEGRVTTWNAGAEHIRGYRAEEIIGKHFSVFCTSEDVETGLPARAMESRQGKDDSSRKVGESERTAQGSGSMLL